MTITDEQLLLLSEGRLAVAVADELRAQLADDKDAEERLRLMSVGEQALQSVPAPDGAGLEALTMAIRAGELDGTPEKVRQTQPSGSAKPVARVSGFSKPQRASFFAPMQLAACLAVLALGAVGGYVAGTNAGGDRVASEIAGQPTWVMRVVDYHTLYGRDTVAASKASTSDIASMQTVFEDALEKRMHIPAMSGRRLDFRRGQVLRFKDAAIIQLAYLPDVTGLPVALCLRSTTKADSKPSFVSLRGMGVVRWRQSGLSYILVGHRTEQELLADAARAVSEITAADTI